MVLGVSKRGVEVDSRHRTSQHVATYRVERTDVGADIEFGQVGLAVMQHSGATPSEVPRKSPGTGKQSQRIRSYPVLQVYHAGTTINGTLAGVSRGIARMKLYAVTIVEVDLTTSSCTPIIEHWAAHDAEEIRECVLQSIENDNANLSGEKAYHLISIERVSEVKTIDGKTAHLRAAFRFT